MTEDQQVGGGGGAVVVEEGEVAPRREVGDVPGFGGGRFGGAVGGQLARRVADPFDATEVLQIQSEREQGGQVTGAGLPFKVALTLCPSTVTRMFVALFPSGGVEGVRLGPAGPAGEAGEAEGSAEGPEGGSGRPPPQAVMATASPITAKPREVRGMAV